MSVFTAKIGGSCSVSGSMSCGETLDNAYSDSDFVLADAFFCMSTAPKTFILISVWMSVSLFL